METPIVIDTRTLMVEGVTPRNPDPETTDDDVHAPELWDAYIAGFMASAEGGNAEYPHSFNEDKIREAKRAEFVEWIEQTQTDD